MKYDPRIHHRRSIRLRRYNYSRAGAYFVTIRTRNRKWLFGKIVDGDMRLNDMGRIVTDSWEWLTEQYAHVSLDEYVRHAKSRTWNYRYNRRLFRRTYDTQTR